MWQHNWTRRDRPQARPWANWPGANILHAALLPLYRALIRPGGGRLRGVWLDVGAHLGEKTLHVARANPGLRVYAFEPNLAIAAQSFGAASNFCVLPIAVAEEDGCAPFHVNAYTVSSSLLNFDPQRLAEWPGAEKLRIERTVTVPTIRLDTFMDLVGVADVEFLKIDAQGTDLAVVRSAGMRLTDIRRIELEVAVTPTQLYTGAATKEQVIAYLDQAGFALTHVDEQSHGREQNLHFERRAKR